ncbi:unnamed protein product [marine sediment metagenome]|uniref:Uncharacterized protein n=1 Tax=marine sediment metagenome TaxID=412755 RepID=X0TN25_9ZZZZ
MAGSLPRRARKRRVRELGALVRDGGGELLVREAVSIVEVRPLQWARLRSTRFRSVSP